jgi:capsular exopolysaccharide synthesis family protein
MAHDQKRHTIYQDFDPEAPETTEFRRIFTRISRRGETERIRTILFTSAERGEGKTTSASLFAMVAALHQGLRTCLVDADLHRPRIEKMFDTPREPGFAEILESDLSIEATLKPSRYETLKIIPAGGRRPFPSELLIPDRLAATLGKLKLLFDLIVVDAPPLLPVSDPAVISREVDGVVMVVRAGRTQRDVALRAKKILDDVGANLLGVIVNNVDDVLPYYYGHTYYQYGYKDAELGRPVEERARVVEATPPKDGRKERSVRSKAAGG